MNSSTIKSLLSERIADNSIGILLSGGFDSAVLLFQISSIIVTRDNPIVNVFTVERGDDSTQHSDRIVNWARSCFGTINYVTRPVGNGQEHHSKQVSSGIQEALLYCDILLLGDTAVPFELKNKHSPIRTLAKNSRIYQPYFEYNKCTTIKIAIELAILDQVSQLSHTCTESKMWRCSQCWQCLERKWAFNKLDIQDSGKM